MHSFSLILFMVLGDLLMTGFFAYAAYVQINDPDSEKWIFFYSSASFACLLSVFTCGTRFKSIRRAMQMLFHANIVASAFMIGYSVAVAGKFDISFKTETGREILGSCIVASWMLLHIAYPYKEKEKGSEFVKFMILSLAVVVVSSIYLVPKYFLLPSDTQDHCSGLGISGIE